MARYEAEQRSLAYRVYVTDCLRQIAENSAHLGGGYIRARYYDIVYPPAAPQKDVDEIVADVVSRAGIEVI